MRGSILDVDGNEISLSLGDVNDRSGESTVMEGDFGLVGGEVAVGENVAGTTIRVSPSGLGFGGAVYNADSAEVELGRADQPPSPDEENE